MNGIVAYGAHVPFARLDRKLIGEALGVRALLLDVGVPLRWHRALLGLALTLAALLFVVVWARRWY